MLRFTDEHHLFRSTVREVVQNEIDVHADAWEAAGDFPAHELFAKFGELGLLGVEYDERWGGGGGDHTYTLSFGEESGRAASLGVAMDVRPRHVVRSASVGVSRAARIAG